jgi:hypothetical protein
MDGWDVLVTGVSAVVFAFLIAVLTHLVLAADDRCERAQETLFSCDAVPESE